MPESSDIFEKNYQNYCAQLSNVDLMSRRHVLGLVRDGDRLLVPFFGKEYSISGGGVVDASGHRPDYIACVILAKYILLCPDQPCYDPEWVAFRDFRRVSHFTNVNIFSSDTERAIEKNFEGKLDALKTACEALGGLRHEGEMPYDLSMQIAALPRLSLLLLFNDRDDEFPAKCTVLFQKHAEYYLDPECLAMTGSFLARSLIRQAFSDDRAGGRGGSHSASPSGARPSSRRSSR